MNVKLSSEHERLVKRLVEQRRYENTEEVVAKALELLREAETNGDQPGSKSAGTIWDALAQIVQQASEREKKALGELPTDFAAEHDHYIYGTPKKRHT